MSRVYTVDFNCHFDLNSYPFDVQTCSVKFSTPTKNVRLTGGAANFTGVHRLNEYIIGDPARLNSADCTGDSLVHLSFRLSRRVMSEVMTTFVPTGLICALCHSTVYYGDGLFKAVVAVNLTSMLCLITMFVGASDDLLKTSYVKMIDVWYLGTLCVPFVEALLATWIVAEQNRLRSAAVGPARPPSGADPKLAATGTWMKQLDSSNAGGSKLLAALFWFQRRALPALLVGLPVVYFTIGVNLS